MSAVDEHRISTRGGRGEKNAARLLICPWRKSPPQQCFLFHAISIFSTVYLGVHLRSSQPLIPRKRHQAYSRLSVLTTNSSLKQLLFFYFRQRSIQSDCGGQTLEMADSIL